MPTAIATKAIFSIAPALTFDSEEQALRIHSLCLVLFNPFLMPLEIGL